CLIRRAGREYHLIDPEGGDETFADSDGVLDRDGVIRHPGTFQELRRQRDSLTLRRWGGPAGEVQSYLFRAILEDDVFLLDAIRDGAGQGLDLAYDGKGRLDSIRQRREGRALVVDYRADGRIASVFFRSDPHAMPVKLVEYEYDPHRRLCLA